MQPARDGKRVAVFACICQARARRRTRRETLACSELNGCATDLQREGTGGSRRKSEDRKVSQHSTIKADYWYDSRPLLIV